MKCLDIWSDTVPAYVLRVFLDKIDILIGVQKKTNCPPFCGWDSCIKGRPRQNKSWGRKISLWLTDYQTWVGIAVLPRNSDVRIPRPLAHAGTVTTAPSNHHPTCSFSNCSDPVTTRASGAQMVKNMLNPQCSKIWNFLTPKWCPSRKSYAVTPYFLHKIIVNAVFKLPSRYLYKICKKHRWI